MGVKDGGGLALLRSGQNLRSWLGTAKYGLTAAVVLFDTLASCAVFLLISVFFNGFIWNSAGAGLLNSLALTAVVSGLVYYAFGVHRQVWRYLSANDLPRLLAASGTVVLLVSLVLGLVYWPSGNARALFGSVIVHWIGTSILLLSARLVWQAVLRFTDPLLAPKSNPTRVLLFYAGEECNLWLKGLELSAGDIEPVGIIDPRSEFLGRTVRQVPVIGDLSRVKQVIDALEDTDRRPTEVILTKQPSHDELSALVDWSSEQNMRLSAMRSPMQRLAVEKSERIAIDQDFLRAVIGRPPIDFIAEPIIRATKGKRIVVTGAGGSIGSELSSLLAEYEPASLLLIDNCEFNLWKIEQKLKNAFPNAGVAAKICDIRNAERLNAVFKASRPDLVFHTAALKHVPIVEANPIEGVLSNVIGTRNVAQATLSSGATAMVQVSTDKAVNPSSVMGATKRLAELYCQALDAEQDRTRFMTVRFGNVLGSSGSLVPLLQKQIEEGGPVTVTDPGMTRFFMTIPEACKLVLQSLAMGLQRKDRGDINVLDMGDPVPIIDIARQMIILNGKVPDQDIKIKYIGVRPGEKLHEELFDEFEKCVEGPVRGVFTAQSTRVPLMEITRTIKSLERIAETGSDPDIEVALQACVPGYAEQLMRIRSLGAA